jgi:hypothetical protein
MENKSFVEAIVRNVLKEHGFVTASNFSLISQKTGYIGRFHSKARCNFDVVGYDPAANIILLVECRYRNSITPKFDAEGKGGSMWFKYPDEDHRYLFAHDQDCPAIYIDGQVVTGEYLGNLWKQKWHIYWGLMNAPMYLSKQLGFAMKNSPKYILILLWFGNMKAGKMGCPVGWIKCKNVVILRMTEAVDGLSIFLEENYPKIKERSLIQQKTKLCSL